MSKHILIVDDSKTVRNLVAFILKAEGFKVTTAEDGLDGLEKLYAMESVDLILSDINMPRMDGFTFIAQVREQDIYKAPRLLNRELKLGFDRAGIEIPFPQVVVHQTEK